ncbi:hypothetical protein VNO77_21209 [Canavalia gladiata]|uniref:ATP-dependent DNA helicase n=1 Tax=Canavalia gladiata TaxID=3824 RepID=A0AAN9QRB4_CANGL
MSPTTPLTNNCVEIIQQTLEAHLHCNNGPQSPRNESQSGYFHIDDETYDPHIDDDHGPMPAQKQSHAGYWDNGDQTHECHYCHAIMWYSERLNKRSHTDNPRFGLCCSQGKVKLPYLQNAPPTLLRLLHNGTDQSRFFTQNIRSFNMMFSFTSMGGQIQRAMNDGNGPPVFVLCGENYHRIGSLLPLPMDEPKFSQLYIYDKDNEVANRMMAVRMINDEKLQTEAIVQDLKHMLDQCNPYVKVYRMARDRLKGCEVPNMKLRIIGKRGKDGRRYNLPTTSEVAALILGDMDSSEGERDIIVETQTGFLKRLSILNAAYLPLQYPLLFPRGEDGYSEGLALSKCRSMMTTTSTNCSTQGRKTMSMRQFVAFRLYERKNESPILFLSKRLFQQFLVDTYSMIESSRLCYIRTHQKQLRAELYSGVSEAILRGENNPARIGKRIVLPSSFTGGARYMFQNYQDAMTICRWTGYPDLFITFTCNQKWPEIHRTLQHHTLRAEDRPDLLCRVFKIKLDHLIMEIKEGNVFGKVISVVYSIEFQKRGLPHAHILIFLHPANKYVTADDIDRIICAEIPDYNKERELFNIVQTLMSHDENHINNSVDEIKLYYDCRYLSSCEAAWRTFAFDIHHREPAVERLSFHLHEQQYIIFKDDDSLQELTDRPSSRRTKFLAWMEANAKFDEAKNLTYAEFPTKFVWKQTHHEWTRRKRGFSIGRLHFVPPGTGELYYLRLLLNKVRGPQSYADIRTVNNITYRTFKEACYTIGLLDDDREYIDAIKQATNQLERPEFVWQTTIPVLTDDILYNQRRALQQPGLIIPEEEIEILALFEIHKLLQSHNKSLSNYPTMPQPDMSTINHCNNVLILDELQYDRQELAKQHQTYLSTITLEQQSIYSKIMDAVSIGEGKLFFLYGYGGTRKTFLWKTISAGIRSKGDIVLTVASSGIAALLLPGGRTAHSRFNIPINIHEDSICNIKQGSQLAELIVKAKLIIWDEAPMTHKHCFEAVDKTFKDILSFSNPDSCHKPFGGKVIVFGGDFRQILPVIPKGSRQDVVHATLNSYTYGNSNDLHAFSKWILGIGEGTIGDEIDDTLELHIPDEFLIHQSVDPITSIVQETYPDFINNADNPNYFHDRAILTPTNDIVKKVNDYMLDLMPGEIRTFISSDQPSNMNEHCLQQNDIHTSKFLNTINCSGLPNHEIKLKVGAPIILLRNIDHTAGMCNGSRMVITQMGNYILQAKVISGNNVGHHIFIPRLSLTPSDHRIPFKFQRRQFPIALSFAMTINKSQGQSLKNVGIYIPKSLFSHGQLYVAVSRVTHKDGLRLLITDECGHLQNRICNVVYKEVFRNL